METEGESRRSRTGSGIIIAGFAMPFVFGLPTLFATGLDDTAVFLTLLLMQLPIMAVFNAIPYFILSHMIGEVGEKGSGGYAGRVLAASAYGLSAVGFSVYTNVSVFITSDPSHAKGYFVIPLVGVFCWLAVRAVRSAVLSFLPAPGKGMTGTDQGGGRD